MLLNRVRTVCLRGSDALSGPFSRPQASVTGAPRQPFFQAVVSTLAVLLGTTTSALGGALSTVFPTGLSAVSFLVFTLLYTPCVAAIATVKKELRSVGSTVAVVVLQCCVAWVAATLVYNIGALFI